MEEECCLKEKQSALSPKNQDEYKYISIEYDLPVITIIALWKLVHLGTPMYIDVPK